MIVIFERRFAQLKVQVVACAIASRAYFAQHSALS